MLDKLKIITSQEVIEDALNYNLAKGHRRCFTEHRVQEIVVKVQSFLVVFSLKKPCFCINIQNDKKKGIRGVWVSKRKEKRRNFDANC